MRKLVSILVLTIVSINLASAQEDWAARENYHYEKGWSIGIGLNIVDDSGLVTEGLFNAKENWNIGNPLAINAEYYFNDKFSLGAALSFNKYKEGKNIDQGFILKDFEANYVAFDLAGKYSFRKKLKSQAFDPYVALGFGYTNIGEYKVVDNEVLQPALGRMTFNTGIGFNYWFSDTWGMNMNAMGKFALGKDVTDHKQYSFGIRYFIPNKDKEIIEE